MRKLWKTNADIITEKGMISSYRCEDRFTQEQVEVLAENDNYIIINDEYFTKINKPSKHSSNYDTVLNSQHIAIVTEDKIFSKGVFYTLYSDSKKRPATVKKEIEDKIQKKFGGFVSIDLGVIK